MLIACGAICLLIGLISLIGQLISTVDFALAQRLGFQEKPEQCEPLYSRLEINAARWDLVVIWTLPLAGLAMLLGLSWWPYVALVAGAIYLDAGGREIAKLLGLKAHGVRMGTDKESRFGLAFLGLLSASGLWAIAVAVAALVGVQAAQ